MAGFDHEFSLTALFEAECDGFMLGHIHKAQQWAREGRLVAYPGSIGRFHYGEEGEKGYLAWDVQAGLASATLIATPSRQMVCIDFDGPPDMARLAEIAADATDKFVRVRWQVDEEHRQAVDREAIKALFSGAAGLKVESRVLPVVRSRAEGISLETTVEGKLARWAELTVVDVGPLQERLQLLVSAEVEAIASDVLARIDSQPDERSDPQTLAAVLQHPAVGAIAADAPAASAVPSAPAGTVPSTLDWLNDDLFAA